MYLEDPLPFIKEFIELLNSSLQSIDNGRPLSRIQKYWLGFCLQGILVTNSVCWARIERASLQYYKQAALSWMFRHAPISWDKLLIASLLSLIKKYGLKDGVLILDDSDNPRSKNAKEIYKLSKLKDKKSGGYIIGQGFVLLLFVSDKITIPVGFEFYAPDPNIQKWEATEEILKKQGVKKAARPKRPERNKDYPTKETISLNLLTAFAINFPMIKIHAIIADALYGTDNFMSQASVLYGNVQVISQLRKNQIIKYKNQQYEIETFFRVKPFYTKEIKLRGELVKVSYCYETVQIQAHDNKKRKIVALKYVGEEEYRYLVVTDSSWESEKIIQTYSLRWLIEVFFQDWKSYEGWGQLAKQTGYEGSSRGLILSLLLDHCLLVHPIQAAQIKDKLPVYTIGSLREKIIVECLFMFIRRLVHSQNPKEKLNQFVQIANEIFRPNFSSKHMNTIDMKFIFHENCA